MMEDFDLKARRNDSSAATFRTRLAPAAVMLALVATGCGGSKDSASPQVQAITGSVETPLGVFSNDGTETYNLTVIDPC
jgi:hypothetical protein